MLKLYAIKDTKGAFEAPFVAMNDALATRAVRSYVNQGGQSNVALYPEDFELWYVGMYDEQTGIVAPDTLACICRLNALVENHNADA